MLITIKNLSTFWGIHKPKTVIHVGAHEAEELDDYLSNGWGQVSTVWVEAMKEKAKIVEKRVSRYPSQEVINALVWDKAGEKIDFQVANNGQSSSALQFSDHSRVHPEIVVDHVVDMKTSTLDDLIGFRFADFESIDFLNLDIQGAELHALRGMKKNLPKVRAIYCEVNTREIYAGCALIGEIDKFLEEFGFRRVDWRIIKKYGWGDALYLPNNIYRFTAIYRRNLRRGYEILLHLKSFFVKS